MGLNLSGKMLDQMDKRYEQVDKRFDDMNSSEQLDPI